MATRIKSEVPLEKRVYENLRKHVDNRYDLLKREVKAAINEKFDELEEQVEEVKDDLDGDIIVLNSKIVSLESLLNGIKSEVEDLNRKANSKPPKIKRFYTPQQKENFRRIETAASMGSRLARIVINEEKYMPDPPKHMNKWDERENAKLESNLIHLVEIAAAAHQRKKSAIMFRIFKILKEAGVQI